MTPAQTSSRIVYYTLLSPGHQQIQKFSSYHFHYGTETSTSIHSSIRLPIWPLKSLTQIIYSVHLAENLQPGGMTKTIPKILCWMSFLLEPYNLPRLWTSHNVDCIP